MSHHEPPADRDPSSVFFTPTDSRDDTPLPLHVAAGACLIPVVVLVWRTIL